jgi:hypothetical protein
MRGKQGRRKIRRLAIRFRRSVISALALMSVWPWYAFSQDSHSHATQAQTELTQEPKSQQSELIELVRESTERFKDVAEAEKEGYALQFGCVSGPDQGAMGLHSLTWTLAPPASRASCTTTRPRKWERSEQFPSDVWRTA